ncbi:hypothetical protein Hte_008338 [Hypoxylon texense]
MDQATNPTTSTDAGFDGIVRTMAQLSLEGVPLQPIVRTLIKLLQETTMVVENRNRQLAYEHAQLQVEHAKLVVDYEERSHDTAAGGWHGKTSKTLFDSLLQCARAAATSSLRWRNRAMDLVDQYDAMATRIQDLEEMAIAQAKEIEALKAAKN